MTAAHDGRKHDARRLRIVLFLAAGYMLAEIVGAWLTNSLALLADAGHMLSDVVAVALSLFANWVARRPATATRTYGYYRAEILAALVNGAALGAMAIYVFVEAYRRMGAPPDVLGGPMFVVATGGLLVNLCALRVLHGGRLDNLNVRGAWLHVLGDTLGSVGAMVAGTLIWRFGWNWADPVASVLIGVLVLYSAWGLLRESVAVLLEGAPGHIDVDEVREAMNSLGGVIAVHDLHVWTISSGLVSLSCHVVARDERARRPLLAELKRLLEERFHIHHSTIQIEPEDFEEADPCG
jgi:cobalt-zinc-cadmium efflux system protein